MFFAFRREQGDVAGMVLAFSEVIAIYPAPFDQVAQAVIDLADADAEVLDGLGLREIGLLLNQAQEIALVSHFSVIRVRYRHRVYRQFPENGALRLFSPVPVWHAGLFSGRGRGSVYRRPGLIGALGRTLPGFSYFCAPHLGDSPPVGTPGKTPNSMSALCP